MIIAGLMRKNNQRSLILALSVLVTTSILLLPGCKSRLTNLEKRFKNKISDITETCSELKRKKKRIISLKSDYQREIRSLKREILSEKRKDGIATYKQAMRNQTIAYDLSLIRKQRAYIQKMEELVPQIDAGINELIYLERDAKADLRMIETFEDQEAKKLINNIGRVIGNLPNTGKLVIKIDESRLESLEKIWNEIVRKRR